MANWYIDVDASGGNDGTSWGDAWEEFDQLAWAGISAGDTIYISDGTYTTSMPTLTKSGSDGSPITIRAAQDAGHIGVMVWDGGDGTDDAINLNGYGYITVDGEYDGNRYFRFQNNELTSDSPFIYSVQTRGNGNIIITYCEFIDSGSGIQIQKMTVKQIKLKY